MRHETHACAGDRAFHTAGIPDLGVRELLPHEGAPHACRHRTQLPRAWRATVSARRPERDTGEREDRFFLGWNSASTARNGACHRGCPAHAPDLVVRALAAVRKLDQPAFSRGIYPGGWRPIAPGALADGFRERRTGTSSRAATRTGGHVSSGGIVVGDARTEDSSAKPGVRSRRPADRKGDDLSRNRLSRRP